MEKTNPFWFTLEPAHIEANLGQVLLYLARAYRDGASKDAKTEETVSLLFRLADETVPDGSTKAFKILGAAALVSCGRHDPERTLRLLLGVYECLAAAVPKATTLLLEHAREAICTSEIISLGLTWGDILQNDITELTATRIATCLKTSPVRRDAWYEGKGTLHVGGGSVDIHPCSREEALSSSTKAVLSVPEAGVRALADKKDKDRTGEEAMKWFLADQKNMRPSKRGSLLHYVTGDTMPVRYTGVDRNGNMTVVTADPNYETIAGVIRLDAKGTHLYRTEDLRDYIDKGRVFPAVLDQADRMPKFSFRETLFDHITSSLHHEELNAICRSSSGDQSCWWTEKGFMAFCTGVRGYRTGDTAKVYISDWNTKGSIRCEVAGPSSCPFTEGDSRRRMLGGFVLDIDDEPREAKGLNADLIVDLRPVQSLGHLLLAANEYSDLLVERITYAQAAVLLSVLTGDGQGKTKGERVLRHLENLRHFASGEYGSIIPWDGGEKGPDEKTDALLALFGTRLDVEAEDIDTQQAVGGLVKAALLLRGNGLQQPLGHVKKEICRILGIQTVEETDGSTDYNFGGESGTQEFKTSVFFAPDSARERNQMKTILKVVCAFLNAPLGGTLYLGVDDDGYPVGVSSDIEYMEKNVKGCYEGMDGYLRYLRSSLDKAFPQEVWSTLTIESVLDGRAVAVRIPPYPDAIVSLEGTAWYRFGSECIKIDSRFRKKLEERKRKTN